jgi:hypothetical protein
MGAKIICFEDKCLSFIVKVFTFLFQLPAMNLFEPSAAQDLLSRLNNITATTAPHWGKMNAAQMMAHCQAPFKVYFGEMRLKRALMGYLFGKMAKKRLFGPKPWSKGLPTAPEFKITDEREFSVEKQRLAEYINRFSNEGYTITSTMHPFFGKLSSQEWATLAYRHLDHHLRQFGV